MRRRALAGAARLLALASVATVSLDAPGPATAAAAAASGAPARALLVFVPGPVSRGEPLSPDPLLRALGRRPGLAVGLMSPTQGTYTPQQALLDISQGTRASPVTYRPKAAPVLRVAARGGAAVVQGWAAAERRAGSAPGEIVPGRLGSAVPGGAAYVAAPGAPVLDAVAGADSAGRVPVFARVATGALPSRARGLLRRHRLVIVALPAAPRAQGRALDALLAARRRNELVVVVQSPPRTPSLPLLPIALATAPEERAGLTSDTTRTPGVVAGIDLLPTVLAHLGLPVDGSVTGRPMRLGQPRSAAQLEALRTRYSHPAPRRIRTLELLLAAWALAALGLGGLMGRAGLRHALRIGALTVFWLPSTVLIGPVLDPARGLVEAAAVVGLALVLALLTDRLAPWPRGPLAPAACCLALYTADLAGGSHLLDRSMLGPNPRSGARFFGIGNELEAALPILVFAGLASAFDRRPRSRAMATGFGLLGALVAAVVGSGYLGADVGGVITISAGAAVAALLSLPGGVTRAGILVAACVPILAVGLLALLELATGASSHFARNVLEVGGGASVPEILTRRYDLAGQALLRGLMPLTTALAAAAVICGLLARRRLYGAIPGPAWRAALAGGLTAGLVGAVANDSGPLLFIVATFVLAVATAYLHGGPLGPAASDAGGEQATSARSRPAAVQEWAPASEGPEGDRPSATVP